jgi:hypothetical protein
MAQKNSGLQNFFLVYFYVTLDEDALMHVLVLYYYVIYG